ncbi:response regulator transcription factor [Candidatus Poriferisodalis sp.]|uniref:response regulator transcription factor n=1 Tax=Candidatus Poriferisodalis sp. TaxID=3101277 RepID=UPI003AF8313D
MKSQSDVARFVGSVAAVASSSAPPEDRVEDILDEVSDVLPFVGACITAPPDSLGRSEIVSSRGYSHDLVTHLSSKSFFDEWREMQPPQRGTRLNEALSLEPLPETVVDYVIPAGFGGGVSVPLSTHDDAFGSMHFSTETEDDITDLAHLSLCIIAPALDNVVACVPRTSVRALLSEREREVLGLVARGDSNAQIAATLYIAQRTVATHVEHILSKLGAANRAHAAVIGLGLGLIPLDQVDKHPESHRPRGQSCRKLSSRLGTAVGPKYAR